METSTSSFTSTKISQDILGTFQSRRLLLHNPLSHHSTPSPASAPIPSTELTTVFEDNVFLIISVVLCGVIGSIVVNFIIRFLFRCVNSPVSDSSGSDYVASKPPVNKGIEENALKTFPVVNYSVEMKEKLPGLDTECVICLSEFESGESLRLLPKCNHGFHVGCIDEWLKSNSSCPKCRQCLIDTSKKITLSGGDSPSESAPTVPESDFCVVVLAPESLISNRGI